MSDLAEKKAEIRQRLLEAQHPRRAEADFSKDPDHNPLVLEGCPKCRGSGHYCEESGGVAAMEPCSACSGRGTTGRVVRYFSDSTSEVRDARAAEGWVTCPWCRRRFALRDSHAWTGLRHIGCGGRITIVVDA